MNPELEDDIWFVPPEERRAACAEGVRLMGEDGAEYEEGVSNESDF